MEPFNVQLNRIIYIEKFECIECGYKDNKDNIRSATLTKTKSGKFELSILVCFNNENESKRFEYTGKHVGIDLGIKDFVITSEGEVFENKHFLKNQEKKIAKLQKQVLKK